MAGHVSTAPSKWIRQHLRARRGRRVSAFAELSASDFAARVTNAENYLTDGLAALTDLARMGLNHGDVKPANFIRVTVNGRPTWKLGDLDGVGQVGDVGQLNSLMASPEQLRGYSTNASDVFGLASSLYDLLFGHSPTYEFLTRQMPTGKLPTSGKKLHDALKNMYADDAQMAAFRKMVERQFSFFEEKFTGDTARLAALKNFVLAGLEVVPQKRRTAVAALPVAEGWAKETRGFGITFDFFRDTCGFVLKLVGLGRKTCRSCRRRTARRPRRPRCT